MSETAREEMDALLNMTLTFSQQMLEEHGEFYAHGASIDSNGELQLASAYTGDEHPSDTELMKILYDAFRQQAAEGMIRAAAVAADVSVTQPDAVKRGDAIRVGIEHADSEPVFVFFRTRRGASTESSTASSSPCAESRMSSRTNVQYSTLTR